MFGGLGRVVSWSRVTVSGRAYPPFDRARVSNDDEGRSGPESTVCPCSTFRSSVVQVVPSKWSSEIQCQYVGVDVSDRTRNSGTGVLCFRLEVIETSGSTWTPPPPPFPTSRIELERNPGRSPGIR